MQNDEMRSRSAGAPESACSAFWRPMESAPKDGTEIIMLFDELTVDIVRLCWWNDGVNCHFDPDAKQRGWWSYTHSVTQEMIDTDIMQPIGWMPYPDRPNLPADVRP